MKGIFYALAACALWGLVFVIPSLLKGHTAFEIAFGRCAVFGVLSVSMLFLQRKAIFQFLTPAILKKAFGFSFIANILHYTALVFGLHYGSETLIIVFLGINPLAIAWYGNYLNKEIPYRFLIVPSVLAAVGLLLLHSPLLRELSPKAPLFSIFCSVFALGTWCWFIVKNAEFLKSNPAIEAHQWVTVTGAATLIWALLGSALFLPYDFFQNLVISSDLYALLAGSMVLGIGSSWTAHYLWNRATDYLPMTLLGQLTLFETLFGLTYNYLLHVQLPSALEIVGIAIILASIILSVKMPQIYKGEYVKPIPLPKS